MSACPRRGITECSRYDNSLCSFIYIFVFIHLPSFYLVFSCALILQFVTSFNSSFSVFFIIRLLSVVSGPIITITTHCSMNSDRRACI